MEAVDVETMSRIGEAWNVRESHRVYIEVLKLIFDFVGERNGC